MDKMLDTLLDYAYYAVVVIIVSLLISQIVP